MAPGGQNEVMVKRQDGFSMAEVMTVVAVLSIAAAISLPQLIGEREGTYEDQAKASLQSAWETAQDYYAGERGVGQPEGAINSYSGFNANTALQLSGDIPWQNNNPKLNYNQDLTYSNYPPSENWAKAVFIMEASDQSLGLCSLARKLAFCMYDDGKASGADGKRYGVRYGVSRCDTSRALQKAMRTDTDATSSWGQAFSDGGSQSASCG